METPSRFVELLRGLGNLSLSQLSYPSLITPPPPPLLGGSRQDIFHGFELTMTYGTVLQLGSTIYLQHGIIGCGTCVSAVTNTLPLPRASAPTITSTTPAV